ncbi:gamma-glutamyltransferase [Sphingomonadaceae bacterium]|nr:gamma-glutamyltransferase [Sphingomonadaceae bacterium]
MKNSLLSLAALPLLAACATTTGTELSQSPDPVEDAPSVLTTSIAESAPRTSSAVESSTGLVSAADPRAAQAGAMILRKGGSATDAAIATMIALTVVEPQSSGIGGGGFFVRGDAAGNVSTIDGREKAPAAAGPDWFLDENGERLGYRDVVLTGLSIGVPGNLRLAEEAHRAHGKLEWAELFQPAIQLAREGFVVTPRFNGYLARFKARAGSDGAAMALYFDEAGEPFAVNTKIRNPALAATLERIASEGPDAFYDGAEGAALAGQIASVTPRAEKMAPSDLSSYAAKPRDAVCGTYRGYRVCGMGPPSSGATTVLAMLGQLERFDLSAIGPDNATFWHLFAESQRLAYADRERYLGDSDFVAVPTTWLTDPAYLASRGAMISETSRLANVEAGIAPDMALAPPDGDEPVENGTSHFVVVDAAGNAVSYTSTIEGPFGSGQIFGGFYLNNELTDFSFTPEDGGRPVANRVEGGKRPRSSMSPTLVYAPDGTLFMAVGAAGGSTIPVQTTKNIIAVIDFGLSLDDALALPVMFSPGDRMTLEEGTFLAQFTAQLEALGHTVGERGLPLKANALICKDGSCTGAADPRSEGAAVSE